MLRSDACLHRVVVALRSLNAYSSAADSAMAVMRMLSQALVAVPRSAAALHATCACRAYASANTCTRSDACSLRCSPAFPALLYELYSSASAVHRAAMRARSLQGCVCCSASILQR